jgi:hypothetical protein
MEDQEILEMDHQTQEQVIQQIMDQVQAVQHILHQNQQVD